MSRGGIKVSGMIASGKLTPRADVVPVEAFGRAEDEDPNELVSGREYMVRLDMLVDSPYQTRLVIDPARVDEVAGQLESQGQQSPIEFRRGTKPNTFEIIKGHTRKYAAISIDWVEVRGLYKDLTDEQADIACMVDNTGGAPAPYEYALMFRRSMERGYAKTLAAVGKMFGFSQGTVSKGLAMLELPPAILALLDQQPGLFGAKASAVIRTLWDENPEYHDIILESVARLKDGVDQIEIKSWAEQRIAEEKRKSISATTPKTQKPAKQMARREVINSPTGAECYVTILKEKAMVIEFKDLAIPVEKAQQAVNAALRQLADTTQAAGDRNENK